MSLPSHEIAALLPLLLPALGGILILLLVAAERDRGLGLEATGTLAILALSAASALALIAQGVREDLFDGSVRVDVRGLAFHLIFVTAAALAVLTSMRALRDAAAGHGEFYALLLFAVTGMTLMASTESLLTLFLGLEILSISLYVLAGFTRDQTFAIEGALKYFLLGAFSTGFVLYGIALFYGGTGRIDLRGIAAQFQAARGGPVDPLLLAAAALLLIGLAFKVAAVPFHFWAPDVYQGALAPVAGFMATGTKAAAFAALLRVVTVALQETPVKERWMAMATILALLTMVVGNVVALAQQNIKRMLAYSSIANAGYLLLAVAAGGATGNGAATVFFYLAAYVLMTSGAFAVALLVGRSGEGDQGYAIASYGGLGRRRPALAAAMTLFMLSLTGIPPTGGFMGKLYIFQDAVRAGLYGPAAVGLLASVVGAFVYLRVVVQIYFREAALTAPDTPASAPETASLAAAALGTIGLGLFPNGLFELARRLL